jgi:hypothetical protein
MFEGYREHYNAEARLVILRALSEETGYRLNDSMIAAILQSFGIDRGRAYVRNQLTWLCETAGAVSLLPAGTAVIAELREPGLDHVERRTVLEGVKRPSPRRGA